MSSKPKAFAAVAVFVKTPGLSPVKSRLARDVGEKEALQFYDLSCAALEETLLALPKEIQPYWSVAEAAAMFDERWAKFPVITQGEGDLGARLATVYAALRELHDVVVLIGADCPHIEAETIARAARSARETKGFVAGPARDGGYYLLAGAATVPRSAWTNVRYSQAETLEDTKRELIPFGSWTVLTPLTDVDTSSDLAPALAEIEADDKSDRASLQNVRDWLKSNIVRDSIQ